MRIRIQILLLVLLLGACESHRSNFDKQIKICEVEELNGVIVTAVKACKSALDIANSNNFSPSLKSLALYKLGRLKRQQGEFTEAEKLLTQSLVIEEQRDNPSNLEIDRRLLEQSLCMAGQNRWNEGANILQRLLPVTDQFSEKERLTTRNTLKHYASQLRQSNQLELATEFEANAIKIKN